MKIPLPILHSALLVVIATGLVTHASAQAPETPPVTITQLLKRDHPEAADRDLIVQKIELQPSASAPPHVHPGMVTGYVISGALEFQVAGQPQLSLKAGDTFFEAPGSQHILARNPSASEKTVIVVFVINPKNQPTAHPLDSHK